ncbi:MAG: diaminopimelate decarboxylase, partial [Elusimicrobia bacterium]|nr:diaminopimelate decarboxylase [Elusimicrobiota bacterium]
MLERGRGGLSIDGLAVEELARRFGTPLYVYSAAAVTERLEALRSAFAAQAPLICYALKANSNRAIISLLAGRGAGADVVSGGELLRARAAGVPADRIVFSGVGKTGEELALGLKQGILAFNVESSEELEALEALARSSRQRAPVMIRLNPGVDAGTHPHVATALPASKFGVAAPQALRLLERAAASRWLRARGIQCHIGSQITDPRPYERAARAVARTMAALARRGIVLELVDLGGGFGVRYEKERELPLRRLASSFCALMPAGPRLILEPGRWLVADAGLLLARVLYRKSAGG